jgi:hypothetical protein
MLLRTLRSQVKNWNNMCNFFYIRVYCNVQCTEIEGAQHSVYTENSFHE